MKSLNNLIRQNFFIYFFVSLYTGTKEKGVNMETNELKHKHYYKMISVLLVVTALALLVYVAFSMVYSSKRFKERASFIELVTD